MPRSESKTATLIRVLLGLLLVSAAVLKARELGSEQIAPFSWLMNPRWQVAIIEGEAALGLWLLLGRHQRGAWVVAIVGFSLLGAASLYLAITGQRSCGCFGQVEANPRLTFALDSLAVMALTLTLPPRSTGGGERMSSRGKWTTAFGAAILLALLAAPFLPASGKLEDALARMRGEPVTLTPTLSDLGEGMAGEQRLFRVDLTNHTADPIRIVGGTSLCGCTATKDLPLTLQAGETQSIEVRVRFGGSPGRFQHHFDVLVDDGGKQRAIAARFGGYVLAEVD